MKALMMSTAAALFAAGTAYAADVVVTIDADADGVITQSEWTEFRMQNDARFGAWDTDGDGFLSADEYSAGVELQDDADTFGAWDEFYGPWDADADGMLSADEYDAGLWTTFDADDDDVWSAEESAAWEEDEMRYDATRAGSEVSAPDGAAGGAATQ